MIPIVHEHMAHSALNAVRGMPFKWSLNPYKGCAHACSYCYARAYHAFLNLPVSSFETQLFVKLNVADLLRQELRRSTWHGEPIAIGTGTDPYQPLEGQYRLTRRCLEAMAEVENPGSVTTKGTLITRDIDVLSDLARRTDFVVHLSLISLDHDLVRNLEPGTPAPANRLRAIERLTAAGIPVSVFIAPVLPGITDQPEQIEDVMRGVVEAGARDVMVSALRLAPGVKEHFSAFIAREFPELSVSYERMYAASTNAPTGYQLKLAVRADAFRRAHGIRLQAPEPVAARPRGQLALPI